jgi:microcystin-dependent protein
MSFDFPPKGWAFCNGQLLPINQNQALFALLGIAYGGNGQTNFALPDFQGRVPIHVGAGFSLGQRAGQEAHTLSSAEMPAHTHFVNATNETTNRSPIPTGNIFANAGSDVFVAPSNLVAMIGTAVSSIGSSQAHENRSPFLALNFCIALQGIFPSPN